jgi:hypothetical protein
MQCGPAAGVREVDESRWRAGRSGREERANSKKVIRLDCKDQIFRGASAGPLCWRGDNTSFDLRETC